MAMYDFDTADSALKELKDGLAKGKYQTVDSLFGLLKRVSGNVAGATSDTIYYLYGGRMPDGVSSPSKFVSEIVKMVPGKATTISASESAMFVITEEFRLALANAVSKEVFNTDFNNLTSEQLPKFSERFNFLTNGKAGIDASGQRISANSVWDYVSEAYCRDAKGNFQYLGHTADDMSVFVQRELPAVLKNVGKKINQLDVAFFQKMSIGEIRDVIMNVARNDLVFSELSMANLETYMNWNLKSFTEALKDPKKILELQRLETTLSAEQMMRERNSLKKFNELFKNSNFGKQSGKATLESIGFLAGISLLLYESFQISREAIEADERGQHDVANRILREKSTVLGVEMGVGVFASMLAAGFIEGLALATPAGAIIGFGFVIASGAIAGGIAGSIVDKIFTKMNGDLPIFSKDGDWDVTTFSNGAVVKSKIESSGVDTMWTIPDLTTGGTHEVQLNSNTGERTTYEFSGKPWASEPLRKTNITYGENLNFNVVTTYTDRETGEKVELTQIKPASDLNGAATYSREDRVAKDGTSVVKIETDTNVSQAKYDKDNLKIEGSWLHKETGEHGGYQRDLQTGTETTIVLDKNNNVTGRTVEKTDGTIETMVHNPETGSRTVTIVNADKSKSENSIDAYGSTFLKIYDQKGNLTDSSWKNWDGTEGREVTNPNDGSVVGKHKDRFGNVTDFSDDNAGNRQEIYYDKNGVRTGDKWKKSDGSHSESKIVEGVKTTVYKDGKGAEQTTIFGTDGSSSTNWKKPDGSKGNVVEGADGTLSGTTILVDGSKQIFSKDANGVTNTDYLTSWGQRVAHTWTGPDGSYGKETFDGRKYTSITVNADKSTQTVSDDGKGNIAIIKRDSSNNTTSLWSLADGTVTFEKTDAKQVSTGIVYRKDGGHVRYVNDKLNASNSSVTYDKQGNFSSSSYKKTDGTSGGVYISDGKREDGSIDERSKGNIIEFSLGGPGSNEKQNVTTYQKNGVITNSTVYANGTHKNYSDDGNGTRTETVFGEGGVGIVSNTTIRYNADGSGIATTTTVNGTTEKTFGPGGITILSKPDTRPDISPPVEKVEADLPSVWDPSVGSGNTADNLPKDKQENGGPNIPAEVKPDDGEPEIIQEPYTGDPNVTVPHIESRIINDDTNEQYNNAIKWQPRRDPLTIDLNGNGLDTTGASLTNPILFDHDGDGIKTGTGWILPDDGFLTLDRNDNGKIDTGAELFGDSTPLYGGGKAQDGFAALADQDSNRDGKVDKLDANWDKLRVWRDLNQDGESQKNELFTLNEIGINSFNVAKTANSVFLANGNQIADLGSYTRVDGTRGTVGEAGQIADVNLAEDTFNSKFTDHIPLVAGVALLPEMQGSGQVRSLREAASIDSAAGRALKAKLTEFAKAKTHAAQRALLEDLIVAWGATSNMVTSIKASHETGTGTLTAVEQFAKDQPGVFKRIDALERFNGSNFLVRRIVAGANSTHSVNIESDRLAVLDLSWTNLSESVYSNLLLQTRFRSLLSQLDLKVDNANIRVNGAKAKAYFEQATSSRSIDGLADLIEFNKYVAPLLTSSDWDGRILMAQLIQSMPLTAELRALYAEQRIVIDPSKPGYMVGTALDDILVAVANSQNMTGNEGNDMLFGGGSNDALDGGAGNDFLSGGAGDDVLIGGTGNDVYLWGKGSGKDQLINNDTSSGRMDVIQIKADTKRARWAIWAII